jgi:tungstate transport system substrate-binding protein
MNKTKLFMILSALFAFFFLTLSAPLAAEKCTKKYSPGEKVFGLATDSPGELGLLKVLAEAFNEEHGTSMCWYKAGSGASLKLLKEMKVDMIMVHAPAAEKKAVQEGWAIKRTLIGSNEFYIVGPKDDPAGIANAESAADAYQKIAATYGAGLYGEGLYNDAAYAKKYDH